MGEIVRSRVVNAEAEGYMGVTVGSGLLPNYDYATAKQNPTQRAEG